MMKLVITDLPEFLSKARNDIHVASQYEGM